MQLQAPHQDRSSFHLESVAEGVRAQREGFLMVVQGARSPSSRRELLEVLDQGSQAVGRTEVGKAGKRDSITR